MIILKYRGKILGGFFALQSFNFLGSVIKYDFERFINKECYVSSYF